MYAKEEHNEGKHSDQSEIEQKIIEYEMQKGVKIRIVKEAGEEINRKGG